MTSIFWLHSDSGTEEELAAKYVLYAIAHSKFAVVTEMWTMCWGIDVI